MGKQCVSDLGNARPAVPQVVRPAVLHPDTHHGEVAPGEQPRGGPVRGHGLVGFVLARERVSEPDPDWTRKSVSLVWAISRRNVV